MTPSRGCQIDPVVSIRSEQLIVIGVFFLNLFDLGKDIKEDFYQFGIELSSRTIANLVQNVLFGPGFLIDPLTTQSIEYIRQRDNSGIEGDLLPLQPFPVFSISSDLAFSQSIFPG